MLFDSLQGSWNILKDQMTLKKIYGPLSIIGSGRIWYMARNVVVHLVLKHGNKMNHALLASFRRQT